MRGFIDSQVVTFDKYVSSGDPVCLMGVVYWTYVSIGKLPYKSFRDLKIGII